jgi:hypothetical protein
MLTMSSYQFRISFLGLLICRFTGSAMQRAGQVRDQEIRVRIERKTIVKSAAFFGPAEAVRERSMLAVG